MKRQFFARPVAHRTLGLLLLIALLALSGCGGDESTPEPEVAPTSTLVPTLPPATETAVPSEPTATAEPVATEAPATVEASEAVTETEEASATEAVTTTEEVTATEATTATEEAAPSAEITATEEVTATHDMGAGHTMTETETVTGTEEVTGSATISGFEAAADARVFFLQPTTNAIVPLTFTVVMSYTGVTLAPAADAVANAGHMHILVDSPFIEAGQTIPKDETHLHFGDASTTAEISLTPGSHILRLQFADNTHTALEGDQFRHEIIVNAVDGAPEQAVRIASPTSGATVPPTFTVVMAATGFDIEPAGVATEGAGHFHLLIDEPFVSAGEVVPNNETHLHFGKAQITTTVTLEPGVHELRLQLADGTHHALAGDEYRAEIEVIVEEDAPAEQVMFVKPADGATVTSPFLLGWAASGLIIETAGGVIRPEGGHLHVLINEDFIPGGEAIPMDDTHLHFGKGQTNTEVTLEPGEYTLRLQMANGAHLAQDGAQYQDEITVTVK